MLTRLQRAYAYYNRKYFASCLTSDIIVKWASPRSMKEKHGEKMGEWDPHGILRINRALQRFDPAWRLTLLHEMAHVRTDSELADHGPRWRAEMRRLYRAGAFDGLL